MQNDGRKLQWYEDIASPPGTTCGHLVECATSPGRSISYQRATKFLPISARNLQSYVQLGTDGVYTFTVTPALNAGYAFANTEITVSPRSGLAPVIQLELGDAGIKGYKRIARLRVRDDHSGLGALAGWYAAYVNRFGGIVNDSAHFEEGTLGALLEHFNISVMDPGTNRPVRILTPEELNGSPSPLLLMMEVLI